MASQNPQQQWADFIAQKGASGQDIRNNMAQYVSEFNRQNGTSWQPGNSNASGQSDTLNTGSGSPWVDVVHGGDDANQWYVEPPAGSGGGSSGGGGGSSSPGGSSFSPIPTFQAGSSYTSSWTPDPRSDTLYNTLMNRSNQSLQINPNDPIIRNQTDNFGAQAQRSNRNYLQGLAESSGPNSNISAETRAGAENVGQSTANFQGALMGRELTARRQEIQDALNGMQGILSDQQKMQLQQQLALMDNALQQQSLAQQGQEFNASLGQGAYQFDVNDEFRRSPLASGG